MCYGAEAAWVPAAISAVGAGVTAYSADDARKKQDQATSAGIAQQAALNQSASQKVNETVQKIAASNPDAEKQSKEKDYLQALQRNKQATQGAVSPLAGASGRYQEDSATAAAGADAQTGALAKNAAAIDAPAYQRIDEGNLTGDLTSQLGLLGGQSSSADYLAKLKTGAITSNPWLNALGSGAQAYGQAAAGRGTTTPVVAAADNTGW